jgi:hypothetical protein
MGAGDANMTGLRTKRLAKDGARVRTREPVDEDLLEEFLSGDRFESQDAFRTLVVRHGPMVLGICSHLLSQNADAEDAF